MNILPCNNKVFIGKDDVDKSGAYYVQNCSDVEKIEVESGHPHLYSDGNCLLRRRELSLLLVGKNCCLPGFIRKIEYPAFTRKNGLGEIELPYAVESIDSYAFKESDVKSVTLPGGMKQLSSHTFEKCTQLQSVAFPPFLQKIGGFAFSECTSLRSVRLPDSVKKIGYGAFKGCSSLESIYLPSALERIQSATFHNCASLKSIVIPDSVKTIESTAFLGCNELEYIKLPASLERIGESIFWQCEKLKVVEIPYGVREVKNRAFGGCDSLRTIYIPSSVTKIAWDAFDYEGHNGHSLTIHSSEGSYAQQFAKKHNYRFVAIKEKNTFPLVCPDCGIELIRKANFCHNCGKKIDR